MNTTERIKESNRKPMVYLWHIWKNTAHVVNVFWDTEIAFEFMGENCWPSEYCVVDNSTLEDT